MIVARRFARDRARALAWWSLGVTAMIAMLAATFPSMADNQALEKMFEDMPPAIKMLAGAPDGIAITSAAGYLHSKLYALTLPLLLVIFGIGLGARAIAGDEGEGTLELLLSTPVTRRRVAIERFAAVVGLLTALALVSAVAVVVANLLVRHGLEAVPIGNLLAATAAAWALTLFHTALAYAVGCATGQRAIAVAVPAVMAVAGYLGFGLTAHSGQAELLSAVSPWNWYLERVIVLHGAAPLPLLAPPALAVLLGAAGVIGFERRDLR